MRQIISLEDLRKYAFQQSFSNQEYRMLEVFLEGLLESGMIKAVLHEIDYYLYPKHLWQKNKKIKIFFLLNMNY